MLEHGTRSCPQALPCLVSRDVYRALSSYQNLIGIWRPSGRPIRSSLYEFHWQPDCITATQLTFDSMALHPLRSQFQRVGPGYPAVPEMLGSTHCVLRERSAVPWVPSTAAESAACVAIAGYGVSDPPSDGCLHSDQRPKPCVQKPAWAVACWVMCGTPAGCRAVPQAGRSSWAPAQGAALSTSCCASCT